jgi:threonine synthase
MDTGACSATSFTKRMPSSKLRGMTMAVTKAVEAGSKAIICASTGNTSASAAAYAARAGIKAFVLIPEGKIARISTNALIPARAA